MKILLSLRRKGGSLGDTGTPRVLEVEDRNADDAFDWAHNLEPGENEAEARRG